MLAPKLLNSSALGMNGTDRIMKISNAAFPSDVYGCERRYILMEVIPEVLSRIGRLIERVERKILSNAANGDIVFLSVSLGMLKEEMDLLEMLLASLEGLV